LIGVELLPVAVVPLTSIVTILVFGEKLTLTVHFNDGKAKEIEPESLAGYVTETGNPKNEKNVREVHISYPSPYLREGVRLIDTPGVGSAYIHNTDVAYRYLPQSDAALFLLSVEQPASKAELDFLRDVRQFSGKIFFLLNKIDYLSESEVRESISFSQEVLREVMGREVKIFPISAKQALKAKLEGSEDLLQRSLLPSFSELLNRFLLKEKGKILLFSATNNVLRILSQARLEVELEQKSLTIPLDELNEKIEIFKNKKNDALLEREQFEILLDSETSRLVKAGLDADLNQFKRELAEEMIQRFEDLCEEKKELSLKELNITLENFAATEVEQSFANWYAGQEEKLSVEFEKICASFISRINGIIDTILTFSSNLFGVPFEPLGGESLWSGESHHHYGLRGQPVGLELLDSSLTEVLPRLVSSRFSKLKTYLSLFARRRIISKRRQEMLEMIDRQAGRSRYELVSRLNGAKTAFRGRMMGKIESTIEGIGAAIEKGTEKRALGEYAAGEQNEVLTLELGKINVTKEKLLYIKESLSDDHS
jgi:hypothetical protein